LKGIIAKEVTNNFYLAQLIDFWISFKKFDTLDRNALFQEPQLVYGLSGF